MINWFDMPAEGLSNGGLFEIKELTATENKVYQKDGEVYNKVTVNVEGGGSSWQTVFEGSVTTESESTFAIGEIIGLDSLDGDSIKVTFNGVEYILPKHEIGYGETGDGNIPNFTNYPLFIENTDTPCLLYTQTAGTYTLKIEEEQSGGSSDFSTAEVTFNCTDEPSINLAFINVQNDGIYNVINITQSTQTVTVPLYKNKLSCGIPPFSMIVTSTSGNITGSQYDGYIITGNCTINYSLPN